MKHRLFTLFVLFTLMLAFLPAQPAHAAATWTVDTLVDENDGSCTDVDCSLRDAVALAAAGDTITFSVTGTITLASQIFLNKNITISGPGVANLTISGGTTTRVFQVTTGKTVSISGLTIANGSATYGGGISNGGDLTVSNCAFSNNNGGAGAGGGGIVSDGTGAHLLVSNCTFDNNSAAYGGGIYNVTGAATVTNSVFTNNSANSSGGAIYTSDALTVTDTTFSTNQATAGTGGAITAGNAGSAAISNSTFTGNNSLFGGGIYAYHTPTTVTNSTFGNNTATQKGGGIFNQAGTSTDPLTVTNSTFSSNSAGTSSGAGIHNEIGTLNYINTILANKTSGLDCANYSIIGTNTNNLAETGTCAATYSADPVLDILGNNGGPTQTMMLLPGSPAIDAGDDASCPATDQRGSFRWTLVHCDIGAYELGNHDPTDIALSASSVAENLPAGTTVGTLTTTDPDVINTHTYAFTCAVPGTDDASFQIGGAGNDELQTAAVFDFETKAAYNICIQTHDGRGGAFDEAFTVTVINVNETLTATFRSVGTYDGWILESGENTTAGGTMDSAATTFNLGDGAQDKQYRAILHFNTSTLPTSAVITKATLKIRKQGLVGTDPFTILGGLKVDMRKPFFGTAGLVIGDFNATAGRVGVATFGATPVSNWYSALLSATGRAYVNRDGNTQFRLYFATGDNDDMGADYMKFFSGNHATASARPTLVIEYQMP